MNGMSFLIITGYYESKVRIISLFLFDCNKIQVHKDERIKEIQHNPRHLVHGIDFVGTAGSNQHKTGK